MQKLFFLLFLLAGCTVQNKGNRETEKLNQMETHLKMDQPDVFFKELYKNFNNRNIDAVIANMTDDVKWANGMDGGFVYGHKGVREYWTRQFTMVKSSVTPVKIAFQNGVAKIQVHQVVHDLNQQLLADEMAEHIFFLKNNKIAEFNIGEKIKPVLPATHE